MTLIQDTKTVAQDEAKFAELARFGEHCVSDTKRKTRMFERGLKLTIRYRLSALHLQTYKEVYERTMFVKRDIEETQQFRDRRDRERDRGKKKQVN